MEEKIGFGILTVSDRCSQNLAQDTSGEGLKRKIGGFGGSVSLYKCIPDSVEEIKATLIQWSDDEEVNIILTTGGTGFAPRDVTPEATSCVIERSAPALSTAMTTASLAKTPFAMLSRAVCGIRKSTIIINLPGSEKGSGECFDIIAPVLKHGVQLVTDHLPGVEETHRNLKGRLSKVSEHLSQDRARESTWEMISVEQAQIMVLDQARSLPQSKEFLSYKEALGRILCEDISAKDPLPPFQASIKDGYAVLSSDKVGLRKVSGAFAAGMSPDCIRVVAGECVRVNTGSPIPAGADAVVQVEDTKLVEWNSTTKEEVSIEVLCQPRPGTDIRPIGSDIMKGEKVLEANTQLMAAELGLLATVGVIDIPAYKLPRVSVISTGNELVEPSVRALRPGMIRDSNRTTLISLLRENGFPPVDMGITADSPSLLLLNLIKAMSASDIVITTGSVSMGDKDFLKQVLTLDLNAQIHFGRVNLKPGKPTTFATCTGEDGRKKLIFCLPGNPVSATVTFHLFVLPALKVVAGFRNSFHTSIKVKTAEEFRLDSRREYKRARLCWDQEDGVPVARVTGNQISSRLLSWLKADVLLVLPSSEEKKQLPPGSMVTALIVGKF